VTRLLVAGSCRSMNSVVEDSLNSLSMKYGVSSTLVIFSWVVGYDSAVDCKAVAGMKWFAVACRRRIAVFEVEAGLMAGRVEAFVTDRAVALALTFVSARLILSDFFASCERERDRFISKTLVEIGIEAPGRKPTYTT
jgi:hypothetical protein